MALNNFVSVCTTDCATDVIFPAIEADQNCTNFTTFLSQVSDLWIMPTGAANPFTWAVGETIIGVPLSVNNVLADNTKTKWIVGEGSLDAPTVSTLEVAKGKDVVTKKRWALNFTVKNLSLAMYDFLRALECNNTNFTFWYATMGDHLFGQAGGIEPSFVSVVFPLGAGREDIEQATITIEFEDKVHPERKINPFA